MKNINKIQNLSLVIIALSALNLGAQIKKKGKQADMLVSRTKTLKNNKNNKNKTSADILLWNK